VTLWQKSITVQKNKTFESSFKTKVLDETKSVSFKESSKEKSKELSKEQTPKLIVNKPKRNRIKEPPKRPIRVREQLVTRALSKVPEQYKQDV